MKSLPSSKKELNEWLQIKCKNNRLGFTKCHSWTIWSSLGVERAGKNIFRWNSHSQFGQKRRYSGDAGSAPGRKGGRRGNSRIGPNQENKAWEQIAWKGPKPRHQGWESLPEHIVWSIGNSGFRILSQGRGMNEQERLDSQMLLSTCFGAEIIYILEWMDNLAARRNMDSWVNVFQNVRQASYPEFILLTPSLQISGEELVNTNEMQDCIFLSLPWSPSLLAWKLPTWKVFWS